jgi:hypothetical protein
MSYIVRGFPGVTLVKEAPNYNAETKTYTFVREYHGTEAAVRGLEPLLRQRGLTYRTDHQGPVWQLFVDEPVQDVDENLDRWEVFTESTDKSLFELPEVVTVANQYDEGLADGELTFRKNCENAADSKAAAAFLARVTGDELTMANLVISHLRAGVTGWQLDLVGLRRTRRMEYLTSQSYQISLDTGLYVYSTAQLGLPNEVAFAVPATPADISTLFTWGWRKRSQRVEIIGSFIDQTVDLLFAPWSTLAYTSASANLAW